MDLTQIRYFLALASTRNFTRAAEQCNVTQSALSRAVQKLEEELGGPLVLRERAMTQLTELGRTMLPLLQQTHDAAESVRLRAADHRSGGGSAPLRLGLAPEVNLDQLMPLLGEVARRVEGATPTLLRQEEDLLIEALMEGRLDIAVLPQGTPLPERLSCWRLWAEEVVLLAGETHPLAASNARVGAAELASLRLLVPRHRGTTEACAGLSGTAGATPNVVGGLEEAGMLVRLGLGVALMPGSLPRPAGTVACGLAEPTARFSLLLAVPAGRPMNPAVSAFVKLARARGWQGG